MDTYKSKQIALMISVIIMTFLVGYIVFAWVEPSDSPPAGNVDAPINIGDITQKKTGALNIGPNSTVIPNGYIAATRYCSNTEPWALPDTPCDYYVDPYNPSISATFRSNVGIGTTNPSTLLHVLSILDSNTTAYPLRLTHNNSGGAGGVSLGTGILFGGETSTTNDQEMARIETVWTTATNASRVSNLVFYTYNASLVNPVVEGIRIQPSGKIVIGGFYPISTTPEQAIVINNTSGGVVGKSLTIQAGGTAGMNGINGGDLILSSGTATSGGTSAISFKTSSGAAPAERLRIEGSGALTYSSISTVPTVQAGKGMMYFNGTKFRCSENGAAFADCIGGGGGAGYWTLSGTDIYNNNTGDVGIGTTSPLGTLHLKDVPTDPRLHGNLYIFPSSVSPWKGEVVFDGGNDGIFAFTNEGLAAGRTDFLWWDGANRQTRLSILNNGNVGIGTTNPMSKLQISGNITNTDFRPFSVQMDATASTVYTAIFSNSPDGSGVAYGVALGAMPRSIASPYEDTFGSIGAYKFTNGFGSGGPTYTPLILNRDGGNVGINMNPRSPSSPYIVPAAQLDVRGDVRIGDTTVFAENRLLCWNKNTDNVTKTIGYCSDQPVGGACTCIDIE